MVEDNPADAGLIREAFEEHGVHCEIILLTNGEQATEFFHGIDAGKMPCPDLVILDLNLPRKSGREVLAAIRSSKKSSQMPIAILTSSDSKEDRQETAALGASRYLRKPSRLADFIALGAVFKAMLDQDRIK